jgi:hypothetical protein
MKIRPVGDKSHDEGTSRFLQNLRTRRAYNTILEGIRVQSLGKLKSHRASRTVV